MAEIVLDGVTKVFDDGYEAVKDMNLNIADGEFVILVGPSGCGELTALRMIARLRAISSGFPNYALYPHMTVRENMGFALTLAKVDKDVINQKVEEAAEKLDLVKHPDAKPANLSAGHAP